jgi:Trk K+ transport system NAD-binding subunit
LKFLVSQLSYLLRQRSARRDLRGFANYLLFLAVVIVIFALLFHVLMQYEGREHSWLTGFYWTLTVMTTLGFGDITFQSDAGRAFSIVVLMSGVLLLLIVLPFAFIRFFYAPWLEAQVRARAPRELGSQVSGHILICHWDPIARGLCERLRLLGIPYFVIEPDAPAAAALHLEGIPVLAGDLDAAATYAAARVEAARAVFANMDDATNSNITLTVREKSATVPIFATAEQSESVDVLELAGATKVLALKNQLGEQLANRVNSRHCEAHVIGKFKNLLIAEFPVHRTPLAGCTIRDTQLRQVAGVNVVAVWERGKLVPARPDTLLSEWSVPVVVGTEEQVQELNSLIELFDQNRNPVLVIGGGQVGRAAAAALKRKGVPVNLIEHDAAVAVKGERIADRVFVGEAADLELLQRAGIDKAPSVVLTTNDDAVNIYLGIYCRRLNPHLRIISRVTHERNVEAIHRAGADFVLSYASLGRESVLALVQGRELIFVGEGVNFYALEVPESLVGRSLRESEIGAKSGLNVVAIESDGELMANPPPDVLLDAKSQLFTIGSSDQRRRFYDLFH